MPPYPPDINSVLEFCSFVTDGHVKVGRKEIFAAVSLFFKSVHNPILSVPSPAHTHDNGQGWVVCFTGSNIRKQRLPLKVWTNA